MAKRGKKRLRTNVVPLKEAKERRLTTILFLVFVFIFAYSMLKGNSFGGSGEAVHSGIQPQPESQGSGVAVSSVGAVKSRSIAIKRVFVTNSSYDGNFDGYHGAFFACSDAATRGRLGGKWVPWISWIGNGTNGTDARDNVLDATYVRLDGKIVAKNKADLTDGSIMNPINMNEYGQTINSWPLSKTTVWTGTNYNGKATGLDCLRWYSDSSIFTATIGSAWDVSGNWTNVGPIYKCIIPLRLYCFEV